MKYIVKDYSYSGAPSLQQVEGETPYFNQSVTIIIKIEEDSFGLNISEGITIRFEITDTAIAAKNKVDQAITNYINTKYNGNS